MGCIRVEKIIEHLCDPLRRCLKDDDPYVRKTAAVCVAKLYDMNPRMTDDQGFLDLLRDLISDSNGMVKKNSIRFSFRLIVLISGCCECGCSAVRNF